MRKIVMKRLLAVGTLVLTILLLPMTSLAEDITSGEGQLDIKITNIKNPSGTIHLSLQNSAQGWLSTDADVKTFLDVSQEITSTDDIVISVEGLPAGHYAISLFHDLNENLDLDTNFIGYPKEPFGFSAPMGMMGPPKFEDAVVEVSTGKSSLEIELN
jgi:uncharacterized protein (DUF2141 family)